MARDEKETVIPFPVKDPDRLAAKVIVKAFIENKTIEKQYFCAKDGEKSLYRFSPGGPREFAVLRTAKDVAFRLDPARKEYKRLEMQSASVERDSFMNSVTNRWLNEKRRSEFKDLGIKDGLRLYQVAIAGAKQTEVIIYVDEKLKYPVKQEFYILEGTDRRLSYSFELSEVTTAPAAELFEIPEGFRETID